MFEADSSIDVTLAALCIELAEQDATDIREGRTATLHEYYSSSTLIVVGLEIEDQQYVATDLYLSLLMYHFTDASFSLTLRP